jgi:hypothetical protein
MGNIDAKSIEPDLRYDGLSSKISYPKRSHCLSAYRPALILGFQEKRNRHGSYKLADPEKALLDWIYLQRQEGLPVVLDELNLKVTERTKLLKYASKYPIPVQQTVQLAPRGNQPS